VGDALVARVGEAGAAQVLLAGTEHAGTITTASQVAAL
jgi:hypothetical protein